MDKDELKKVFKQFLEETEIYRIELSADHDIPVKRNATFSDFIDWVMK